MQPELFIEAQSRTLQGLCSHHEVEKKIVFYDPQGESSAFMSTENPFLQTEFRPDLPSSTLDRETQDGRGSGVGQLWAPMWDSGKTTQGER